ncbi:MAG TPA: adenylate/guanylate cyclase domain-containing protein [Usitatibacter sp.]|nr:adenylate/guanylate cyclase domain-containing protein [Usitatibacter sp.]
MNTRSHAMLDQANRTFICSVVFIDLVGYSKKPVTEQIRLKTSLTNNLSEAIKDIPVNDRIILDTGDGAAISFLGDPEDALVVTLQLREMMQQEGMTATQVEASGDDAVRMGINLGPVKLVKDINGHPNIIGDGINVAQRIMSFARPGQIVVSRSYYDVVSNLASEYAKLFTYEGSRTDKHVREHEIYVVGHSEGALRKARDGMKDRASATSPNPRRAAAAAAGTSTLTLTIPHFAQDRKKLSMIAGGLAMVVLVLLIAVVTKKPSSVDVAAAPSTTSPARPAATEPATRGAEMAKPESRVLEPAPAPSMIPMPAPAETTHEPSAKPDRASRGAASEASRTEPRGEPRNEARTAAAEPRSNAGPPATVVFAVSPWGEIVVNGRSRGVTPPMKSLKLEPGHYKIEVRNTTFPAHTEDLELKARDEVTVRHKFQ